MNEREFYQQVLGLSKPWKVKAVRMELKQRQIVVEVECEDQIWGNPSTGARAQIHEWNLRRWRHLDTCQFETLIEARVPRLRYEDGRTEEVTVPWAERYSRLSKLMESFVIQVVESCHTVKEAAGLVGLGVDQVDGVMRRAVKRGLERRAAEPMKYLGMDEKSIGRGHRYATMLNDLEGGRVLKDWYASAIRSRLRPIKAVAHMLKSHAAELLNYILHRISNAASEGLNSTIQLIKANARGLPNFQNFRIRILYCGKLDMLPA